MKYNLNITANIKCTEAEIKLKLSFSAQMRELDKYAIEELKIPGELLMTNAARCIVDLAVSRVAPGVSAAVFCGTGNNGGDGVAAATRLIRLGFPTRVFMVGDPEKISRDTAEMIRRLNESGRDIEPLSAQNYDSAVADYINGCGLIIDAVFGIGLNTNVRGDALYAITLMNSSPGFTVSADIPSGVEADTGRILGAAVSADATVTFSLAKPGHFIEPGCTCVGELKVCDIGLPEELVSGVHSYTFAVTGEDISIPPRQKDSHKGDYGRDLIIAGSIGYTGSPALAARAASKSGAGLVYIGAPEAIYDILAVKCDEEMPFPLPCDDSGILTRDAFEKISRRLDRCDVCLFGPGIGQSDGAAKLACDILSYSKKPLVIDADGITLLSENIDVLDKASCSVILTPHSGEFERLGGDLSSGDRLTAAVDFAKKHDCVLVLKGHRTITAFPNGAAYINTTGGPALAKAGSGDVLAGLIASLIGQRFDIKDAVLAAVYIHGLAGDMCAETAGEYSVTAGNVVKMIPNAMMRLALR